MQFRAGYSYHNQWWILHNTYGAYEASGIHGQMIHINPAAEMVVIKLSSHPMAGAGFTHIIPSRSGPGRPWRGGEVINCTLITMA
jgi:CubicO group peptidase (beta-lactamase class C family)